MYDSVGEECIDAYVTVSVCCSGHHPPALHSPLDLLFFSLLLAAMAAPAKKQKLQQVVSDAKEIIKQITALLAKRDHASKKEGLKLLISLAKDTTKSGLLRKIGFSSMDADDAMTIFGVDASIAHRTLSFAQFAEEAVATIAKGTWKNVVAPLCLCSG
jgi:flagellar motor component MotA